VGPAAFGCKVGAVFSPGSKPHEGALKKINLDTQLCKESLLNFLLDL